MSFRTSVWAAALIFATRTALALDSELAKSGGQLEVQAHFGAATAPFDVSALPEAKGQAFVLAAAGSYAVSEPLSVDLRIPLVLGSVAQPAGSYLDAAALGNPQLGARYRFVARRAGESQLALLGAVELGAPLASHASNLLPNRVLAIADGIEGRGRPEWFTPGVTSLTPSGVLGFGSARWSLQAELRLPLFVRVSEADLPSEATDTKSVGLATVAGVEARYRLSQRLSLAAAAHLFLDVLPVTAHVRDVSRVQDFERLSLHVHFGSLAGLVVDLQTAAAGDLGGGAVAGGLRGVVNFR